MKMRFALNRRIVAGWIMGILLPLICVPIVIAILSWAQSYPFSFFWSKFMSSSEIQSKVVSLSIIPNLAIFYFFLNRERYDIGKGIIIGSACFLPFILYVNFA